MKRLLILLALTACCFAQTKTYVDTTNPVVTNGMKFYGAYVSVTVYPLYAVVAESGATYVSLVTNNVGNDPASSPTQWQQISSTGATLTLPFSGTIDQVSNPFSVNLNNTACHNAACLGADLWNTATISITPDGFGKNLGNPNGVGGNDPGWRSTWSLQVTANCYTGGICQGLHVDTDHHGSGDTAFIYAGNGNGHAAGGAVDGSGEGVENLALNGTEYGSWYVGTVTSTTGTGDIAPVVACCGSLVNDGYLIDTSKPALVGTITGSTTQWETNPINLTTIPTTGVTPSTGECIATTYIASSGTIGVPQAQSFSCTVHNSKPLTTGLVWVASPYAPEQCTITGSISGSGTQTGTINCAKPHPIGSYIFQGGTHGCLSSDDDLSKAGNRTDLNVYGGADSTHLIVGMRTLSGIGGWPRPGVDAATVGSGIHVFACALLVSLKKDGRTMVLEQNDMHFANGDNVESPDPTNYVENVALLVSTQHTATNPSNPSNGIMMLTQSTGWNYAHAAYRWQNQAPLSSYRSSGGGWIDPPPFLAQAGGVGNILEFDDPLQVPAGGTPCGGGFILCDKNPFASGGDLRLFGDAVNGNSYIVLERAHGVFSTGLQIKTPPLTPPTSGTTCEPNVENHDDNFVYFCTSGGIWKRAPLSIW